MHHSLRPGSSSSSNTAPHASHPLTGLESPANRHGFERVLVVANAGFFARGEGGEIFQPPGGLASGVAPVLGKLSGSIAISANTTDSKGNSTLLDVSNWAERPFDVHGIDIDRPCYDHYYAKVANGFLWPLMHGLDSYLERYPLEAWTDYINVNAKFASDVLSLHKPGDLVWVHDYHLMLAPRFLRLGNKDINIAYFHHIPFPDPVVFFKHFDPDHGKAIINGLLGADLVGFHTRSYAMNFLSAVHQAEIEGAIVDYGKRTVTLNGRTISIGWFPISVDVERIEAVSRSLEAERHKNELRDRYAHLPNCKILFGVERLDYTKGLLERVQAFGLLLSQHPELREKVVFLQHAAPSRDSVPAYGTYRSAIEREVARINNEYGNDRWKPIDFIVKGIPLPQILGYRQGSDIFVVTPLYDGMNLTVKEIALAHESAGKPIVLSRGAGAAEELLECILVDGRSPQSIKIGLLEAIRLHGTPDMIERSHAIVDTIRKNPISRWSSALLTAAHEAAGARLSGHYLAGGVLAKQGATAAAVATPNSTRNALYSDPISLGAEIAESSETLFAIQYDGCLTSTVAHPDAATLDGLQKQILLNTVRSPGTSLVINSGRTFSELARFCDALRDLKNVSLSALHGGDEAQIVSGSLLSEDRHAMLRSILQPLKDHVRRQFALQLSAQDGLRFEDKGPCLAVHYRNMPNFARDVKSELSEGLEQFGLSDEFNIVQGDSVLEVVPKNFSRVEASQSAIRKFGLNREMQPNLEGPRAERRAVVVIGNASTDNEVFEAAKAAARIQSLDCFCIQIGCTNFNSSADLHLPDINALYAMLAEYTFVKTRAT